MATIDTTTTDAPPTVTDVPLLCSGQQVSTTETALSQYIHFFIDLQ